MKREPNIADLVGKCMKTSINWNEIEQIYTLLVIFNAIISTFSF